MQNNRIILYPIGPVENSLLEFLADCISRHLDLSCRIESQIDVPDHTFSKVRAQYDAKLMLTHLKPFHSPGSLKIVGVTQVDLFVPILKFIFGVAQIDGPLALISMHRLCPRFYDLPRDEDLLKQRAEKTLMHELGHAFGLTHCRDKACVMYSSVKISDTDRKKPSFCDTCQELFRWRLTL